MVDSALYTWATVSLTFPSIFKYLELDTREYKEACLMALSRTFFLCRNHVDLREGVGISAEAIISACNAVVVWESKCQQWHEACGRLLRQVCLENESYHFGVH